MEKVKEKKERYDKAILRLIWNYVFKKKNVSPPNKAVKLTGYCG